MHALKEEIFNIAIAAYAMNTPGASVILNVILVASHYKNIMLSTSYIIMSRFGIVSTCMYIYCLYA